MTRLHDGEGRTVVVSEAEVLDYYDCPQVFVVVDALQRPYVCVTIPPRGDDDFVAVRVKPVMLDAYKAGRIDLLDLIRTRPCMDWFLGRQMPDSAVKMLLTLQDDELVDDPTLMPGAGYFHAPSSPATAHDPLGEA